MPDVVQMFCVRHILSDPFGNLAMSVCDESADLQDVLKEGHHPLQAFQFHMVAPTTLVALKIQQGTFQLGR